MLTTEWGPVGTRGGCGAGWGPGACPGGNAIQWGLRGAQRSHPNEDKHQAPSSTPPRPLSLQDPGLQAPQWIGFPDSVVNIHQDRDCPRKHGAPCIYSSLQYDSSYVTIYVVQFDGHKIS